jgi:hypothetical protein
MPFMQISLHTEQSMHAQPAISCLMLRPCKLQLLPQLLL